MRRKCQNISDDVKHEEKMSEDIRQEETLTDEWFDWIV